MALEVFTAQDAGAQRATKRRKAVLWRTAAILLLPLALAACGGSGGDDDSGGTGGGGSSGGGGSTGGGGGSTGGGSSSSVLSRYFVESFEPFRVAAQQRIQSDPRYLRQQNTFYLDEDENGIYTPGVDPTYSTYPLKSSGVYWAHAAGLTGLGQIIAIIDDGILAAHEAFAGKSISTASGTGVGDHGTMVASVAAGDSSYMIGMAPGADLAFGSYDNNETRRAGVQLAEDLGAVALNNSWGFVDTPVNMTNYNLVFRGSSGQAWLNAMRSYADEGVIIFAASNEESDTQADLLAALPAIEPELEDAWIAVVNGVATMDGDDIISAERISAACMEAAAWCLAAEGTWVGANASGTSSYGLNTGTSFAAPMVAGAMAILAEAFPDMSPHDLRIRLLASADNEFDGFNATGSVELVDGFFHDISDEWGHGFLDVQAALLPIGTTTATMSDGSSLSMSQPLVVEGSATGDAVARALAGVSLVASDSLNASFSVEAQALAARSAPRALTSLQQRAWRQRSAEGCCGEAVYFDSTRVLTLSQQDVSLRLALPDDADGNGSFGLTVGRDYGDDALGLSVRLTVGRDEGDLLPSWFSGGGNTIVAGEIALGARIGPRSRVELATSIGTGFGSADTATVSTGAVSLNAARASLVTRSVFQKDDSLKFTVGIPVAVTSGTTTINLPVATRNGVTTYQDFDIDMAPSQREARLGIEYGFPIIDNTEVVLSAMHAENFGNVAGQTNSGVFIGMRTSF